MYLKTCLHRGIYMSINIVAQPTKKEKESKPATALGVVVDTDTESFGNCSFRLVP